ncbi:MAG TPA: Asp23/Gls24 family envelope stress response protein [Bacillales bacterium]
MAEQQTFEMDEHELGTVEISPEVIEVIASIAATEVEGVAAMRGSFATGVAERLGRPSHGKGVKVDLKEDGITIDVYVLLNYGVSIPEVGQRIQDNICQTLRTMTSLEVSAANIHVVGIQFEEQPETEEAIGEQ